MFDWLSRYRGFRPAKLRPGTGPVPNPGRGWYRIFYFMLPDLPDLQELRWSLREEETLALAVIHIGAYRDRDLDQEALDNVVRIFEFFRLHRKDLILRFAYDCEGNGLLREPTTFSQVEAHIRQLMPIVRSYTETILVFQGLFVGSWGEMHGSRYLSTEHLRRLNALVEAGVGEHTWLAVRRPCQWRTLHSPQEKTMRMGLFDDGIFGSESHLGTFGHLPKEQARWEDPWCPADELAFEGQLCEAAPQGGEAVFPRQDACPSGNGVLRRLRQMRVTYLNSDYDPKLLDVWKQESSAWPGVSLYGYVGAHLGYRFLVRNVRVKKKQQLLLEIAVENVGFAPCYEACSLTLELVTPEKTLVLETSWDLRTVMAGTVRHWEWPLPEESGALYLRAQRKKDGREIRFAHEEQTGSRLLLGHLTDRNAGSR